MKYTAIYQNGNVPDGKIKKYHFQDFQEPNNLKNDIFY